MEITQRIKEEDPIIRVSGLKKKYRLGRIGAGTLQGSIREWKARRKNPRLRALKGVENEFYALNGVDLEIRRGETVGIIGRNGAGKSTLLKVLSRITAPTEGVVDLYGRVTSMLEVGTGFHGDMTGRENIYLNGAILGMTTAEIDAKMDKIIAFAGLEQFIDTPIKRYSSGMYVKLGFSVAYHLESEIIIMDEVLAVGDHEFQQKCLSCLRSAAEDGNRTVLYVSHNMSTVRQLCRRCLVLDRGTIVYDGDTDTAISMYLGGGELTPARILYGPEHKPDDAIIRADRLFSLDGLALTDREEPIYLSSEDAVLRLTCTAAEPLRGVGFRFEIWYQDDTKVATALSGNFAEFSRGTSDVTLRMPLKQLVSGRYRADIIVFLYNGTPLERKIDAVYPGFQFQINAVSDERNYLDWDHKYWGAIRLDDISVENVGEKVETPDSHTIV